MISRCAVRGRGSDPLVSRGLQLVETHLLAAHADQYHFEPAPSTATSATTGATLADQRTTVATVLDFFIAYPSLVMNPAGDWVAESN